MSKLEELIIEAAKGLEDARKQFDTELLQSKLFFPVRSQIPEGAREFTSPNQPPFTWAVSVVGGNPSVPVFTEQQKLEQFFKQVSGWENRWMEEDASVLMKNLIASNLTLSLNPLDKYGVTLPPGKMAKMISKDL